MEQSGNTTRWVVVIGITLLGVFLSASAQAAVFTVNSPFDGSDADPGNGVCETGPGNSVCTLRAAIQEANHTLGGGATVILPAVPLGGFYTLQIPASGSDDETTGDLNITNSTDIIGAGAASTIIDGNSSVTNARVFLIDSGVSVRISGVTVRNGRPAHGNGGGILNLGTLTLTNSTVSGNIALDAFGGGGIYNDQGTLTLTNSTVSGNSAFKLQGGGIYNNQGTLTLTNSTVSGNTTNLSPGGGGISNVGTAYLENTILALNTVDQVPNDNDCAGALTSLGNNLIGDPTGCTINLQPTDLTGDPGLGEFIDDGAPGHGRLPLLSRSQAISGGNAASCPPTDQLGTPRNGPCDIGAVEFYPVVNDLVALGNLTTAFDPTPVPGGPAGTFRITADFTNTSNQAIVNPLVEIVELTGENLLLNADGGAGGVGARLRSPSSSTPMEPGASKTVEFLIGLHQRQPFTFFVNMLGDARISDPSVSRR